MIKTAKVLVIGGASLDITCISKEKLVPCDSNPSVIYYSHGGVGRNIVENMARLGVNTAFISVFGDDVMSKGVINALENYGVDCSRVRIIENRRISSYISILDNDVELALAASDFDILNYLNVEFFKEIEAYIRSFDIVFVDGNISVESLDYLSNIEGIRLFADGVSYKKVLKLKHIISRLEYIKINLLELEALSGMKVKNNLDLEKALDIMVHKGIKRIFVTLGADGALCVTKNSKYWIRGRVLSVLNITGAGDAFAAASAYAYSRGYSDKEALGLASAAAEITLDSLSTVSERMEEAVLLKKYKEEYEADENYSDIGEVIIRSME